MSDHNQEDAVTTPDPASAGLTGASATRPTTPTQPSGPPAEAKSSEPETTNLHIVTAFTSEFRTEVDGEDYSVFAEPTEVPTSVADDIIKSAKDHGIKIKKARD